MLHTTTPSTDIRTGRVVQAEDRAVLENWDTRVAVCAEGGLLAKHGVTAAMPDIADPAERTFGWAAAVDGLVPIPLGFTPGTGAWWDRVVSPSALASPHTFNSSRRIYWTLHMLF
jgi:hypothetical protein